MSVYNYTAKDEGGNKFTGVYNDVESVSALRQELGRSVVNN